MFAIVDVPILGIVGHMGIFVCPTCGFGHPIFRAGGAQAETVRLGVPFLGNVPLSLTLRKAPAAGRSVACEPKSPVGKLYSIARSVSKKLAPAREREYAAAAHPAVLPARRLQQNLAMLRC
jgi:ATP-binding protein involved in chromosome partitioning